MCVNKKIDIGRKRRTCGWCSAGFSSSRRCHSCGCIRRKDPTCPSDPRWAPGRKTAGYTPHHSVKETTLTRVFLDKSHWVSKFTLGLRHSSCSSGQEWTLRLIFKLKNETEELCKRNLEVQLKAPVQILGKKKDFISYQTVNKCSVVRLFEWEFTESAGAKSSCRITRGSSIFIVPWKRERKRRKKKRTRHPRLVTVTNRGYYTSSKFFFPRK